MIGSYIMNVIVSGPIYDHYADKQNNPNNRCYGLVCFQQAFLLNFYLNIGGMISSLILAHRHWDKYQAISLRKSAV